ncbi:MAG: flagellar motor switch protein FliM, partial [Pseudomonadota bacterium]
EVETEKSVAAADRPDIDKWDFESQDRMIRGRMPTLDIINERFARSFRTNLGTALRKLVDVSIASTDIIKFGEFIRSLPVPTSIHIFKMEPLRGYAIFVIESRLVYSLVDSFLGGSGISNMKIEGRDFTPIENQMINKVVMMSLKDFELAWEQVHEIKAVFVRSEMNPQFAAIVPGSDVVLVIRYDVELDQTAGNVVICIPYSTIEPVRGKLCAGFQSDQLEVDIGWKTRLQKRICEARVDVVGMLGTTTITGRQLLDFKAGDIVQLNTYTRDPLLVKVQGIPKFRGFAGTLKGNKAVKLHARRKRSQI